MVHSTFSLLFFFSERAIVSQFWLFFVPAEEGVDEKWGEREREVSRCARCFSPWRLALVSFSRVRIRSARVRSSLVFFSLQTSFARETFLSAIVECVFSFSIGYKEEKGEEREKREDPLFFLLPFFKFFFSLPHRKNSLLLLLLLLLLFVNAKNTDPSLLFLLVLLSSQLRRLS